MKIFKKLRTARISSDFQELTVRQMRELCAMSDRAMEAATTRLLTFVMAHDEGAMVKDPRLMTVQERARALCHYLGTVIEGGPNFKVGEYRYSDFIEFDRDYAAPSVATGEFAGESAIMCDQLLGVHAELLESVCSSEGDWRAGLMACQIRLAEDPAPDLVAMSDADRLKWVEGRMSSIMNMPSSQAVELWSAYEKGAAMLQHFFIVDVDPHGIVFRTHGEEVRPGLGRFRSSSCVEKRARALFA